MIYGIGVNDTKKCSHLKSYTTWKDIIRRCYDKNSKSYKYYGAKGVTVCDEWKLYSNFKKWYDENYIEGYVIDKDIKGGKVYSPDSCMFISKKDSIREMTSRRDSSYISEIKSGYKSNFYGKKPKNTKDLNYYENTPTTKGNFIRACCSNGWSFCDFTLVDSKLRTASGNIKYYYIKKEK